MYRQYQDGTSPEEIASNDDGVSVADVHAALAFVFDNPDLVRSIEAGERRAVERIREERPVEPDDYKERA